MFKVGDRVKIIASYSCFYEQEGMILSFKDGVPIVFIKSEQDCFYFQMTELEKIYA